MEGESRGVSLGSILSQSVNGGPNRSPKKYSTPIFRTLKPVYFSEVPKFQYPPKIRFNFFSRIAHIFC